MANAVGGLMVAVGMLVMFVIWIYTTVVFFSVGDTVLGVVSIIIPPAAIVLPFLVSPILGFIGIAAMLLAFGGFALRRD